MQLYGQKLVGMYTVRHSHVILTIRYTDFLESESPDFGRKITYIAGLTHQMLSLQDSYPM